MTGHSTTETAVHSCPACPRTTTADGLCPACEIEPTSGDVCDICNPGPLLAEIADAHVSPDAIRAAVEAEREEIAVGLDVAGHPVLARQIRSRGRVSLG